MRRLGVDIAGVHVSLGCADDRIAEILAERWRGFLTPSAGNRRASEQGPAREAEGDQRLAIEVGSGPTGALPCGVEDRLRVERDGSRVRVAGLWLAGEVDLAGGAGHARVDPRDAPGSIENFLRVAVAHLLLPRGGFLLHAAAIVTERGAVVAFGPSGSGKTTFASLAGARPVISDDLVALVRREGELRAVPCPFRAGGAPAFPDGHRVAALCRVRGGHETSLEPIAPSRALRELASAMPFVHDDAETSGLALARAAEAVRDPGVSALTFARNPSVWTHLETTPGVSRRAS